MDTDSPIRAGSERLAGKGAAGAQAWTELEACRKALHRVAWESASPEDCRRHARRCEVLAGNATIDVCREAYLRMALCWRKTAAQVERREGWPRCPGHTHQRTSLRVGRTA